MNEKLKGWSICVGCYGVSEDWSRDHWAEITNATTRQLIVIGKKFPSLEAGLAAARTKVHELAGV